MRKLQSADQLYKVNLSYREEMLDSHSLILAPNNYVFNPKGLNG